MRHLIAVGIICVLCISAGAAATQPQSADIPEPLLKMLDTRTRSFRTAHVEWIMDEGDGPRYYSSRYAGNDFLLWDYGDADGCVLRGHCGGHPELKYPLEHVYSPHGHLYTSDDEQWNYQEEGLQATFYEPGTRLVVPQPDIRTIGIMPWLNSYEFHDRLDPRSYFHGQFPQNPERRFTQTVEPDGTVRVTSHYPNSGATWYLDPNLGFQPRRMEGFVRKESGEIMEYEADLTYRQYGDRWFVEEVEFNDLAHGRRQWIEVLHASFDQPDHPQALTPAGSLGMVPWISVARHRPEETASPATPGWGRDLFDGEKAIGRDEYKRRRAEGTFPSGEQKMAMLAFREQNNYVPGAYPPALEKTEERMPGLARTPGLWEPYTRRFVIHHRFDRVQYGKAFQVLHECQKPAYEYLDKREHEIDEVDQQLAEVQAQLKAQGVDETARRALDHRIESARERKDLLLAPVERIFEDCLKARLNALLTPNQRERQEELKKAAAAAPATTER